MNSQGQISGTVNAKLPILREHTERLFKGLGAYTHYTLKIPQAVIPLTQLLTSEDSISQSQLSAALDTLFDTLYEHPLTSYTRKLTAYLRKYSLIPNEETTENLIGYIIEQVVARSPVPIPKPVIDEFWIFFRELFSEPELKGLVELNLDIARLILRTYEPLLVDLINLLKETKRINQANLNQLITRVQIIQEDLTILRRQIKAIRYVKPFFQTDPRDFHTQAQIVARMVREFGPFFIKMAQVAAANADFLPDEIARELLVFQEDVTPMTSREVLDAFQECYGRSPYECYVDFDVKRPLKSGSIGSVYLAKKRVTVATRQVLVPVIIKIGRRNLEREFLMGKTTIGLTLLSSQFWAPHSKLAPFLEALLKQVDEFAKGFEQELNFETEARVQNKFARRAKKSQIWDVPKVYAATPRIIEMEYLEEAVSINRAFEKLADAKKNKFRRYVAERFIYTVLIHIFVYKEFHGDLHPGNVMVTSTGKIYLIDWGNSVKLRGKWKPFWNYLRAVLAANPVLLTDAIIAMSTHPEDNQRRWNEIRQELENTLKKKNLTPLGKDFVSCLYKEGGEGLYRRMRAAMHLISNTQRLGVTMKSDYLHLSRSLLALTGTYASLCEGLPSMTIVIDVCKTLSHFPLNLAGDRVRSKRAAVVKQLLDKLPFALFPKRAEDMV